MHYNCKYQVLFNVVRLLVLHVLECIECEKLVNLTAMYVVGNC